MWKTCKIYRNRSLHVKLNQVGVEMTILCLWFSLIAIENILSKLLLLFVRVALSWMPNGGFVQDLTAEQARLPWSDPCSHTASAFIPAAQHHICAVPPPQPHLQSFLFSVRVTAGYSELQGLPLDTTASQEWLCCAHPLTPAPHLWLAWLLFG